MIILARCVPWNILHRTKQQTHPLTKKYYTKKMFVFTHRNDPRYIICLRVIPQANGCCRQLTGVSLWSPFRPLAIRFGCRTQNTCAGRTFHTHIHTHIQTRSQSDSRNALADIVVTRAIVALECGASKRCVYLFLCCRWDAAAENRFSHAQCIYMHAYTYISLSVYSATESHHLNNSKNA